MGKNFNDSNNSTMSLLKQEGRVRRGINKEIYRELKLDESLKKKGLLVMYSLEKKGEGI